MGALAAKHGPRLFMGLGPIIGAAGWMMMAGLSPSVDYWTDVFPGIVVFGIGLAITVAPLTAAILGDVDPKQAGIASAVNNAVARVAGLIAVAAVGAVVAAQFQGTLDGRELAGVSPDAIAKADHASLQITPPKPYQDDAAFRGALEDASVSGFQAGIYTVAGLMAAGGVISLYGIRNPPNPSKAAKSA
jgi:hypothetical protein